MSEYIVEMKHITKRFPGIVANDDVSLGIKKGEIFALLGENGAGKSTLMSMLFGMYEPDEGEIWIRGKKEDIHSPSYATKLNIGMVHQHFKLIQNYSITENIILGLPSRDKRLGFLPYVDLKKAEAKVSALSEKYGREAEILIFDEPTAVLTPQEISFLLEIIRGLRDKGKTIILITHKLAEIKQVADRCAILNRGKLVDILDVAETSAKTMANLMVGREVNFTVDKPEPKYGKTVLQVENLTVKNRDGFSVVKNVSFSIRSGEIFAIAGVAGNGQIEIADAIAGLAKISEGKVILNGKAISVESIRRRILEGISYIPEDRQDVGLVMDFSLEDNLVLKTYKNERFSKKGILSHKAIRKNGEELIKKYDIRSGQGCETIVRSMSGGNQQKAIIGREIELDSDLMIFVQPTRGLDIGAIENIHKQIIAERNAGKAILLISLELDEIMNCADTIGVIYNGEMQKIADAKELSTNQVGEFMMGVKHEKQ